MQIDNRRNLVNLYMYMYVYMNHLTQFKPLIRQHESSVEDPV